MRNIKANGETLMKDLPVLFKKSLIMPHCWLEYTHILNKQNKLLNGNY